MLERLCGRDSSHDDAEGARERYGDSGVDPFGDSRVDPIRGYGGCARRGAGLRAPRGKTT